MRNRLFAVTAMILLLAVGAYAQNEQVILKTYFDNFEKATLEIKVQILRDASANAKVDMGPLYLEALKYILNNSDRIRQSGDARELSTLAIQMIEKQKYMEAKDTLWRLFESEKETLNRITIMGALGEIAQGDPLISESLNSWLAAQNSLYKTGIVPEHQVVSSCVLALGKLKHPSSFPVLFHTMMVGYSDEITKQSEQAMYELEGDFTEALIGVVQKNPVRDKLRAVQMARATDRITKEQQARVAEFALRVAVNSRTTDNQERILFRQIRIESVEELTANPYGPATGTVIEHFNQTLLDFDRGNGLASMVLEGVACLGAIRTPEAALRLAQYLELINQYTEQARPYDDQIVLAVIRNLGAIGDPVAFNTLTYTNYLGYSSTVKAAARDAISRLNW